MLDNEIIEMVKKQRQEIFNELGTGNEDDSLVYSYCGLLLNKQVAELNEHSHKLNKHTKVLLWLTIALIFVAISDIIVRISN